jgi:hypothetical protein
VLRQYCALLVAVVAIVWGALQARPHVQRTFRPIQSKSAFYRFLYFADAAPQGSCRSGHVLLLDGDQSREVMQARLCADCGDMELAVNYQCISVYFNPLKDAGLNPFFAACAALCLFDLSKSKDCFEKCNVLLAQLGDIKASRSTYLQAHWVIASCLEDCFYSSRGYLSATFHDVVVQELEKVAPARLTTHLQELCAPLFFESGSIGEVPFRKHTSMIGVSSLMHGTLACGVIGFMALGLAAY